MPSVSEVDLHPGKAGAAMEESDILTPGAAEAVIEDRIQQFGLGALPRVQVTALADGTWRVRWEERERTVSPMTRQAWGAWLEENVGSLDPGALDTTES
jgi:hypothetical protein